MCGLHTLNLLVREIPEIPQTIDPIVISLCQLPESLSKTKFYNTLRSQDLEKSGWH